MWVQCKKIIVNLSVFGRKIYRKQMIFGLKSDSRYNPEHSGSLELTLFSPVNLNLNPR